MCNEFLARCQYNIFHEVDTHLGKCVIYESWKRVPVTLMRNETPFRGIYWSGGFRKTDPHGEHKFYFVEKIAYGPC